MMILAVMFITLMATAQSGAITTITPDTLTEVETEYFTTDRLTGTYETLAINALCTQLGGTSDGSALLQGSVDGTSWNTLTSTADKYYFYANDTLTITNGVTWTIIIDKPALQYYRIAATGTASDTTLVTVKYTYKK